MSRAVAERLNQAKARANKDKHEVPMSIQIRAAGLPAPERDYRFGAVAAGGEGKGLRARLAKAKLKDWRFDLAWPEHHIALEIEGAPGHGRHTNAAGYKEDCCKYNEGALLGWTIYRVTGDMVQSGVALNLLIRVFLSRGVKLAPLRGLASAATRSVIDPPITHQPGSIDP
jgi:hypothetical protein